MAMLEDIGAYLVAHSFGTAGTNLFYGDMPETPDVCIALFEYAGEPPEDTHDSKGIDNPGLQVRVRGTSYATARATVLSIQDHLHTLHNTALTAGRYLLIRAVQSPFSLGRDSQNRIEIVQNFIVTKAR